MSNHPGPNPFSPPGVFDDDDDQEMFDFLFADEDAHDDLVEVAITAVLDAYTEEQDEEEQEFADFVQQTKFDENNKDRVRNKARNFDRAHDLPDICLLDNKINYIKK